MLNQNRLELAMEANALLLQAYDSYIRGYPNLPSPLSANDRRGLVVSDFRTVFLKLKKQDPEIFTDKKAWQTVTNAGTIRPSLINEFRNLIHMGKVLAENPNFGLGWPNGS